MNEDDLPLRLDSIEQKSKEFSEVASALEVKATASSLLLRYD